ncbi:MULTISPECIES: hypothetical protein [unclassified Rathayibacter]|uniref:hypothetical protein n=1 Tax=unclassified Rathayibacter TaxID=2609250 RepID=UPI000CE8433C|nr:MULTISPECIES: hypothetical protein [unclassified Rathayibacter]PPF27919.1 hypothetical protein C5C54_08720 [Rathayibacter sp. AY1F2]PPH44198.1 hypothetical protein C5C42_12540 [Rathayibacter sp. AY1F7]
MKLPRSRSVPATAATAALVLALCGCSADGTAARRAADAFLSALADGDGAAACALLTDSAREAVQDREGDCPADVLELGIAGDGAGDAEVYGRAAIVRSGSTAVFLTPGDDGWLVRAAGCTPVADAPFECVLDGS